MFLGLLLHAGITDQRLFLNAGEYLKSKQPVLIPLSSFPMQRTYLCVSAAHVVGVILQVWSSPHPNLQDPASRWKQSMETLSANISTHSHPLHIII